MAVAKTKLIIQKNPPPEIQTNVPIPLKTTSASVIKNNVITLINKPSSASAQKVTYKESPEQQEAEVTPSPTSLPPTTKVPARLSEARIKKIDPGKKPTKINRSITLKDEPQLHSNYHYQFWQLIQHNWARYNELVYARTIVQSTAPNYSTAGILLYDLQVFPGCLR